VFRSEIFGLGEVLACFQGKKSGKSGSSTLLGVRGGVGDWAFTQGKKNVITVRKVGANLQVGNTRGKELYARTQKSSYAKGTAKGALGNTQGEGKK